MKLQNPPNCKKISINYNIVDENEESLESGKKVK